MASGKTEIFPQTKTNSYLNYSSAALAGAAATVFCYRQLRSCIVNDSIHSHSFKFRHIHLVVNVNLFIQEFVQFFQTFWCFHVSGRYFQREVYFFRFN